MVVVLLQLRMNIQHEVMEMGSLQLHDRVASMSNSVSLQHPLTVLRDVLHDVLFQSRLDVEATERWTAIGCEGPLTEGVAATGSCVRVSCRLVAANRC